MAYIGTRSDQALRQRALDLAESGRFAAPHQVEEALIGEGWPNAGIAMRGDFLRKAVADRCAAAQG